MKSKTLFSFIVLLIVLMVIGVSGSFAQGKDPIKIGLVGALSTPYGISNKISLEIYKRRLKSETVNEAV